MNYWFMVSNSRILCALKVDSYMVTFYVGFLLTSATREQMPYPLYIHGSCIGDPDYTATTLHCGGGMFPEASGATATDIYCSTLYDDTSKYWADYEKKVGTQPGNVECVGASSSVPRYNFANQWGNCLDGTVFLRPVYMQNRGYYTVGNNVYDAPNVATVGQLDGIFLLDGTDLTAESIVTISGVDYLLVNNYYRVGRGNICALRLT